MTTTINASTGNNLQVTADGSGVLNIQSNGVNTNAQAWANFAGTTTPTIRASYNVSSITYSSTGFWVVNLTNALTDTNAVCIGTSAYTSLSSGNEGDVANTNMITTSTVNFSNAVISSTTGGNARNPAVCQVVVFR